MIKIDVVKQPNFTELAKQMPPTQQDMHRLRAMLGHYQEADTKGLT